MNGDSGKAASRIISRGRLETTVENGDDDKKEAAAKRKPSVKGGSNHARRVAKGRGAGGNAATAAVVVASTPQETTSITYGRRTRKRRAARMSMNTTGKRNVRRRASSPFKVDESFSAAAKHVGHVPTKKNRYFDFTEDDNWTMVRTPMDHSKFVFKVAPHDKHKKSMDPRYATGYVTDMFQRYYDTEVSLFVLYSSMQ